MVSLEANMREAAMRWSLFWFYRHVRRTSRWDFKLHGYPEEFRDFGNCHYGAVGTAMGLPAWLLLRAAGLEHWWTRGASADWGRPWSRAPYGDDPRDAEMIRRGIAYAHSVGRWPSYPSRLGWRAFDIAVALSGLLVLGPLILLLAVMAACEWGWPPLDGSWRLGRFGRPFRCWKIRTLPQGHQKTLRRHLAHDEASRRQWDAHAKLTNDPRPSAIGRALRRLSLDDTPQLWNILMGEMAFFGPRAFLVAERERLGKRADVILSVTPGMVSYYGAYGRARMPMAVRVRMEARYVRRMHRLYVKWQALVGTVRHCAGRTGAG